MAYPVLLWDQQLDEPRCIGCMACVNYCPTQCMSATLRRNPAFREGAAATIRPRQVGAGEAQGGSSTSGSPRRTLVNTFEVDLDRCIECGICVDMCNYEAIALGLDPPASGVLDLDALHAHGRSYQAEKGETAGKEKPNVRALLEKVRHRLPPASASDAARRAHSRLRESRPINLPRL